MDRAEHKKVLQAKDRRRLAILRREEDIAQRIKQHLKKVLKEHLKKMAKDRFNPQKLQPTPMPEAEAADDLPPNTVRVNKDDSDPARANDNPLVDPDVTPTMRRTRAEKVLQVRHRLAILRGEADIALVLKEHLNKMADDRFNLQMTDVLPGFQNAVEIADFEEEFETSDTAPAEGITVVHNRTERVHGLNEDSAQVADSTLIPTDPTVYDSATEHAKVLRVRHRMALFLFRGKKKFAKYLK